MGESTSREKTASPLFCVIMNIFDGEKYLAEAIESVLGQGCDFVFELIISDDCSTDGTLVLASSFEQKYPNIINVLPTEKYLGITPNFMRLVEVSRGRYLAMLEGNDYWTGNHKLQS